MILKDIKFKKRLMVAAAFLLAAGVFVCLLPGKLFDVSYSVVLLDKDGNLLQARIADDGQWRFPPGKQVPEKFKQAIVHFEDKRFAWHLGVDVLAVARAMWYNIKQQKVVSGGSTITMQVVRLSRNKSRNVFQKIWEMVLSVGLECKLSKQEILALYAAHAPFGGNVVGLEAASWRYFGRNSTQLSWAEAATLAVLPNNPSMVRPDRNRQVLKQKRDALLVKLKAKKIINDETFNLALLEPIPDKPFPLPEFAPHLLGSVVSGKIKTNRHEAFVQTTLNIRLQQQVNKILLQHHKQFEANAIHNAAAMVMEVETGHVLAYVGNVYRPDKPAYESYVDIIPSKRSPGSTLKPILFAAMLNDGLLLPNTLVADIPTQVSGYAPQNFDLGYDGAVPASMALARSLNVPAIRMLQQYRIERFYDLLKHFGISTLTQPSTHYGLSLILGGGENSMWELCGMYASMARLLNHYSTFNGRYNEADVFMPTITTKPINTPDWKKLPDHFLLSAGAIYSTIDAMKEVARPGEEQLYSHLQSAQRIAWKTGTSFGFRDGWAIGLTPKYVVAVWVGNANGEGRPGLTGLNYAAPIMFELFRYLPTSTWFDIPFDDMQYVAICIKSGYRATALCNETDTMLIPLTGLKTGACPYHQWVHLSPNRQYRVNDACESPANMIRESWFVLPPVMEWYYKSKDATYKTLPPYKKGCEASVGSSMMEMIYPRKSSSIYVPVELDGKKGRCVFEVAHRQKSVKIYWHVDEIFIGVTEAFHQKELNPTPGKHKLVLVDEHGERLEQYFEVLQINR